MNPSCCGPWRRHADFRKTEASVASTGHAARGGRPAIWLRRRRISYLQLRLLTFTTSFHRLIVVYRSLAFLLIPALVAASGAVSPLHTHVYGDHDHPEHHHGPAVHEHQPVVAHPEDGRAHLEGCSPGRHAVSLTFVCATPPQVHAQDADVNIPGSPTPPLEIEFAAQHTDIRVHGPPPRAQASPRAPPATLHA